MNKAISLAAIIRGVIAGTAVLAMNAAGAAAWPDRPLRLVVPFPAGGSYDILGRTLARKHVLQTETVAQFPRLERQVPDSKDALLVRANLALDARAGTPDAVVERLYREVRASVQEKDFLERLQTLAYEPVLTTPAESRRLIHAETVRYGAIARTVNLESN